MQCPERDRLNDVAENGLRELKRIDAEKKLEAKAPSAFGVPGDASLVYARQREQAASSDYVCHIAKHGCATSVELGRALKRQLDVARMAHLAAAALFDRALKENCGVPKPDGALGTQQLGHHASAALQDYVKSLKRFSDFVLRGTLPEELRRKG